MPPLHVTLRRPLYSPVGLSSLLLRRCLSQHPVLRAASKQLSPARPPAQVERSIRVLSKEMQQMPSDLGILAGTFVTPTGKNVPSLFQAPRSFLKLQWKRLLFRLRDQFGLLVLIISSPKEPKQKGLSKRSAYLSRSTIAPTAVALHQQMYSSFAEGGIAALRRICADGIYHSLRARIASRPRGEIVQWKLVKYTEKAKIVSNRAARLPIEGVAIRQAVVRICSQQKLTRWKGTKGVKSSIVPGSGKEKDVVEYVVIQKRYEAWKPAPWEVWGTISETTLQDVEEWEKRALE